MMKLHIWKRKLENPWKLAFFMLIGILLGVSFLFFTRITDVREVVSPIENTKNTNTLTSEPSFELQLTKDQVNQLINFYLKDLQTDSLFKYNFALEKQALLTGSFYFLGHDLNFYLYFDPLVLDNGDIQLKAKSISVGTLSLPISELLNYAKKSFTLPSWVEVDAKNQLIDLHLQEFKFKNGIYIKAEQINLVDDVIQIGVYLPTESTTN